MHQRDCSFKKKIAIQERTKNIIKGFVTLIEYLCIFYRNNYPKSTKRNNLQAGCIMIYFVKDLRSSFFEWLQESKDTVIRIILQNINEQTENTSNYVEIPILEQES